MPPQLTDVSPEIERDAAARRQNFSIVSAKDAIDQALAARLKASAAALDEALSEKDAAGPPRAATRGVLDLVLGLLRQYWRAFRERRPRLSLHDLSDRELMDIGLTRGEIDSISPQRTIDTLRDGMTHPWSRRGM
ncbi:DUF1127 domain-containing protein [Bradyrhizobium diazoefficiens]|nr:DUF1127 domain-containing protein [Bradyrhizobium diazoefficiens]MBR0777000.1 DUF1127 domain-containing protein [Bradyrhizobium diazoefficiens]